MAIQTRQFKTPLFYLFVLLLLLKALFIVAIVLYGNIGLGPDEAQYWTWSRALDWGYYSKPPGIAWQIWLGTQIFAQTELGVRFLSILLSTAQAITVYWLALQNGLRQSTAFWCGILMAFCPIGILGALLAITDGGFLLCWTLACAYVCAALNEKRAPNPFLVGLMILLGALFKWPIYLFWIFYFLFRWRHFPYQPIGHALAGVGISLLGLLPSMWWNWSHEWATFRHVSATVQGGHSTVQQGNFLEFIGAQILLLSPVLFGLLVIALYRAIRKRFSAPLQFCACVSLSSLALMSLAALFQKIQGNWGVFAYPTGLILIGWYACEHGRSIWLKWGVGISIALAASVLAVPTLVTQGFIAPKANPFKHNMDGNQLAPVLIQAGYDPLVHFLVSDKYQAVSILSFYGPEQKRAYFLNLQGLRNNQFSYWPQLCEEQKGKTGYFVAIEQTPQPDFYQLHLEPYFERVEFVSIQPLSKNNGKSVVLFKCINCLQKQPVASILY
jgi:4-amino-4-deoxy-L-arabinose transferase-like glycosyltransferase